MEKQHVLSILVNNNSGVMVRVGSLFSRRGFSIDSISAATTENDDTTRMTIVTTGDTRTLEQIDKQLSKLHDVKEVKVLTEENSVRREHVIIQVNANETNRHQLVEVANLFRANILNVNEYAVMLELTSEPRIIKAFIDLLNPYGIRKMVKSGLLTLERD